MRVRLTLSNATSENWPILGQDSWLTLRDNILSREGKEIVTKDPNLTKNTINLLLESEANLREVSKTPKFYFGDKEGESDIGLAILSSCISDNPKSTLAEIVARYSFIKNAPFIDVAIALIKLKEENKFVYYTKNDDCENIAVSWTPTIYQTFVKPPSKSYHNTTSQNIDDEIII